MPAKNTFLLSQWSCICPDVAPAVARRRFVYPVGHPIDSFGEDTMRPVRFSSFCSFHQSPSSTRIVSVSLEHAWFMSHVHNQIHSYSTGWSKSCFCSKATHISPGTPLGIFWSLCTLLAPVYYTMCNSFIRLSRVGILLTMYEKPRKQK